MEKHELIERLSKTYAISIEDAEKVYESFENVVIFVKETVGYVWDLLKPLAEYLSVQEKELDYCYSNYFPVTWDDRKPSQVTLNKPRYMVRKIIR